jgi:DNA integrity scanning protein DisA with diadenylate cyclase activity
LAIWYENAIKEIQKTSQEDAFQDLIQEARKLSRESYDESLNTNNHLVFDDSLLVETDIQREVIEAILHIAEELKNEGREGHSIGTSFIIGDSENVMGKSRQLIINPFQGHDPSECRIQNPDFQETIKEFAQLDGAFVVRGDGVLVAAGRYITVDSSMVQVTSGYGTRHSSVAAITQYTRALGIVVSQSGGKIKIFKNGKSIIPHS